MEPGEGAGELAVAAGDEDLHVGEGSMGVGGGVTCVSQRTS